MAEDWEQRYKTGDMPWEKGEASPGLVDFLSGLSEHSDHSVLVPGCGTGHDVRAFARARFRPTGMDLAPSAVSMAREKSAGLPAEFRVGDFLRDQPEKPFDWIFEHTLFCAIQPAERDDYVRAVLRWLKPGGSYLAVYYLIPDRDGPPFGTTQSEIRSRFQPHFELLREWVPRSYPHRTNLEWMVWWKRKPVN